MSLTSSDPSLLSVPATVTVAANKTTATFTIQPAASIPATTAVTITASTGPFTRSVTITVNPTKVSSLYTNPYSVIGGQSTTGYVNLLVNAPAGGAVVSLTASSPLVTVPSTVTVPAGTKTTTFAVQTAPVAANQNVTITGSQGGGSAAGMVELRAPTVDWIALDPSSVPVWGGAIGTIFLPGPAPAGGYTFWVTSCNPELAQTSEYVTVPAGETTGTFEVSVYGQTGTVTIEAGNASAELTITP